MPRSSAGAPLALARAAAIDTTYMRGIVERLAAVGSSPLGFRVAGTPEDRAVAELVADEMRAIGLQDVAIEPVPVDGWRFRGARIELSDGPTFECASMGGVPGSGPAGVTAPLVDVGAGERRRLDRLPIAGRIALVDWCSRSVSPADVGLELGRRGAVGMALSCPPGGPYYQSEGALGSFNSGWHHGAPPMVTMRKEDAGALRAAAVGGAVVARLVLEATIEPGAAGCNAVGYLAGSRAGAPIVVGAHHDGWFSAAFDNASGVAAMLAIARALAEAGHRPRHPLCFTSRTAEEYGLAGSDFDWCTGAWRQVTETHPDWGARAPFHLCLEASGHPALRLLVEAPPELRRWARGMCRTAEREGWLTSGWRVAAPVTGTELWPLLLAGIPGVTAFTWENSFARTDYHSPLDTPATVDFAHLGRLVRLYTLMLLDADADPGAILDHRARAREVARAAATLDGVGEELAAAAARHAGASGRRAFTRVGRALHAVDAHGGTALPHEQAARDVRHLDEALAALAAGDRRTAVRHLARVGDNAHARTLSRETFAARRARRVPRHRPASWATRSHLTASPDLWAELAALRGEPGAREPGPWIDRSLRRHRRRSAADVRRRVAAMARALAPPTRPNTRRTS